MSIVRGRLIGVGHTVIQVPVPALESITQGLAPATVCPHITLLGPFVDRRDVDEDVVSTIRDVLTPVQAFDFKLSTVGHFGGVLTYLTPSPAEPFIQLTGMFAAAFPPNRAYLTGGGGHYIHAEKLRHTNTEAAAALARPGRYRTVAGNLRVKEVHVAPGGHGDGDDGVRTQRPELGTITSVPFTVASLALAESTSGVGRTPKAGGRTLDGRQHSAMPPLLARAG